jgi:hypothetical protein
MKDPFQGLQLTDWIDGGDEQRPNKRCSLGETNTIPDLQVVNAILGAVCSLYSLGDIRAPG